MTYLVVPIFDQIAFDTLAVNDGFLYDYQLTHLREEVSSEKEAEC